MNVMETDAVFWWGDDILHHLPLEAFLDLPILTGEELYDVAMAKKSSGGGLNGWAWNEVKALSLHLGLSDSL